MQRLLTRTWKYQTMSVDGNAKLFGVNIFDYEWKSTGKEVIVRDPSYKQEHKVTVYTVDIEGKKYQFAAGEFSNCVWRFYLYKF